MKRRTFLAGLGATAAASTISAPALAQSANSRVLKFVPRTGLTVLDPSNNVNATSNAHGYAVFDTLYGMDDSQRAHPQMVEGHTVSSDGLTWELKLRPGLKFHDGERVLAKDAVASVKRWSQRDSFGQLLAAFTNELTAADDNTIRFRLNKPFGVLPDALGRNTASPCCIMPERIAIPDASKNVTEMVGSGPLKWVASEFVAGQRAVYEKNKDYVPRQEKAEGTAGGKVINFDRVEWRTIADFSTAAAALQSGEVDWWETVQFDLLEVLRANKEVTVTTADPRYTLFLRYNCGTTPFNNAALRRVVTSAISQNDIVQAIAGDNKALQKECYAFFGCGLQGVEEVAKGLMGGKKDYKKLSEDVKKTGYNGEKILLLRTTDEALQNAMGPVVFDMFQKIGLNAEMLSVDLATSFQRRASTAPVAQGGWSAYASYAGTGVNANPGTNVTTRGLGPKGFVGNYEDPELEQRIVNWVGASDSNRTAAMTRVQERLVEMCPTVPLGMVSMQTAFRSNLSGYLPSTAALMWNMKRA